MSNIAEKQHSEFARAEPFRVAVIGSGNWGTTVAKIIAENTNERPEEFVRDVNMWVYEETIDGRKLTDIINEEHENVKYLPGVKLPKNLHATPDLLAVASPADILVFNVPHQFLSRILTQLKGKIKPTARAISCLKGLNVEKNSCQLLSTQIENELNIHCGVLSGANLAPEIARECWSETTVAYVKPKDYRGKYDDVTPFTIKHLFHRPAYFHVQVIEDIAGASLGGALKNVIALAVGFVDGLNWGDNAKGAIIRLGLREMIHFGHTYFPGAKSYTLTCESAGAADLITSCAGGRNFKVGREIAATGKPAEQVEAELLNGQSAQGIITAAEVYEFLSSKGDLDSYPLLITVYLILIGKRSAECIPEYFNKTEDVKHWED
ncbi:BA75_01984T0 [Komagataella pastoris]|uniref:Glycerol-3-phosphate dehydrogenase [NAD(+)] n=1 Tax=Komagataella pastoris TaxID=4922 RepID=A0A1B2JCN7_PICPA|nr:BA75_01984T0 [Komagataella pastoris]